MSPATKTPATKTAEPAREKKIVKLVGVVDSDKRDKTRTVVVKYQAPHPKYGKYVSHKTIIQAHDEKNESRLGDTVEIVPCRPMSKSKKWTLSRIVTAKPRD